MKVFGIRAIPGSRYTTWHGALYHGCSARIDGKKGSPFRDNQFRTPLSVVFNRQTKDKIIFPDKLCFPKGVSDALKALADIEFLPCVSQECFDVIVSPNSLWPLGIDSSATAAELLSAVKKIRLAPLHAFSELVPPRLFLQPDADASENLTMTFRKYLHVAETETVLINIGYFRRFGIVYYESWYWFISEIWDLVSELVDSDFFILNVFRWCDVR